MNCVRILELGNKLGKTVIRAVLTSEQQEKFEKLRQHRRRMVEEMLQR